MTFWYENMGKVQSDFSGTWDGTYEIFMTAIDVQCSEVIWNRIKETEILIFIEKTACDHEGKKSLNQGFETPH